MFKLVSVIVTLSQRKSHFPLMNACNLQIDLCVHFLFCWLNNTFGIVVSFVIPFERSRTDWLFQNKVNNVTVSAGTSSEDVKKIRSVSDHYSAVCVCERERESTLSGPVRNVPGTREECKQIRAHDFGGWGLFLFFSSIITCSKTFLCVSLLFVLWPQSVGAKLKLRYCMELVT